MHYFKLHCVHLGPSLLLRKHCLLASCELTATLLNYYPYPSRINRVTIYRAVVFWCSWRNSFIMIAEQLLASPEVGRVDRVSTCSLSASSKRLFSERIPCKAKKSPPYKHVKSGFRGHECGVRQVFKCWLIAFVWTLMTL